MNTQIATLTNVTPMPSFLRRAVLALATVTALAFAPGLTATAHAAKAKPAAAAATDGDASSDAGVVNLNTATEDELMLLPGVGPSKAAGIVAWRKKYGSFKRIEDLGRVKGFGHKTIKKLKPYLAVSGATTLKEKPGRPKKTERDSAAP